MKKARIDPWASKPEKFLAKESELRMQQLLADWPPIRFSVVRRKNLVARLLAESPEVLYEGDDLEKRRRAVSRLMKTLQEEIQGLGIAPDPRIVEYLLVDVLRDPDWRRAVRRANA